MEHEKLDQVEFSIEAALRGLAEIREGGSKEAVVTNLHRALLELNEVAAPDAATLATLRA